MADGGDLNTSGSLTRHFSGRVSNIEIRDEPLFLAQKDGLYYVHAKPEYTENDFLNGFLNGLAVANGAIHGLSPRNFFEKYGDVSSLTTLADYKSELASIPASRDAAMNSAVNLYNQAIDLGYETGAEKIEYNSSARNFDEINLLLNERLQDNENIPQVALEQIKEFQKRTSDLATIEGSMVTRLNDIENDVERHYDLEASDLSGYQEPEVKVAPASNDIVH